MDKITHQVRAEHWTKIMNECINSGIASYEGSMKHIYFVAESKGTLDTMKFNHITPTEHAKIDYAQAHFKAISTDDVVYSVVDSYQALLEKVMK